MEPRILHALELATATIGQTILLAAAWGFLSEVFVSNPLYVRDSLARIMFSRPSERTWIVTLVATEISVATTTFLSTAFKEALRHRMHKSISLIHLSGAIALTRGSFLVNLRHLNTSFVTLTVFAVTKLLVSSWTALLAPSLVNLAVNASAWELDITSGSFESMLQQELVQSGAALVRGDSTEILNLDGVLSGIAAAQYSFGSSGIFDFNCAKYNISTGGILPAAPGYGGATNPVPSNDTGLAFAGGLVPTQLALRFPQNQEIQGLNHSFVLQQQGLTADVKCYVANSTIGNSASYYPMPVPLADGTTGYWLWAWNITSDCSEGQPSQQQLVTKSDSPTVPQGSSGFLASLVCPYPLRQTGFSWNNFTVFTNASWRYDFLPVSVCTITPLVTTSLVSYSNGVIDATVISSGALGISNSNLTQFLAAHIDYQTRITQGLTTNSIGDALYSIYVALSSENSTTTQDLTNTLLREMEHYWRGVIEFSGTFVRSAFSVYPRDIPIEARIPLSGQETITTMGWRRQSPIYGYTVIPITVVALMIYGAVAYTIWHVILEHHSREYFTRFDPSNPVHLMMVSSARDPMHDKDNLGDSLGGFERGGIKHNELSMVELTNVSGPGNRKRFRAVGTTSGKA